MASSTVKTAYWRGFRAGLPFVVVIVPFGMLFGVVATEAGLHVLETLTFSVVVIAGAAQFTALQLLSDGAPTLIAVISALAVNLRLAMYSASLTPHLGSAEPWHRALVAYFTVDQSYATSIAEFEKRPQMSPAEKLATFFGTVTPVCPLWYGATVLGAMIGGAIPEGMALDFAVPITFIALVAPMLRSAAHVSACLVAVVLSLALAFLPFNLGLLVAAIAGMMTGAQVEVLLARRGVTV